MMRINLLPWRAFEERRRRRHFLLMLALALALGVAIVYWGWLMAASAVGEQQARNAYLHRQIAELNHRIRTIKSLKATRANLLARMHVIERLERSRPVAVHLFEQLAATVPSSVYLTRVSNNDGRLRIEGIASSPSGVSDYMRNIAASPWLAPPDLQVVRTTGKGGARQSRFSVSTQLSAPKKKSVEKHSGGSS